MGKESECRRLEKFCMNIPDELHSVIFEFFNVYELISSVELVCRRWYKYSCKLGYGWKNVYISYTLNKCRSLAKRLGMVEKLIIGDLNITRELFKSPRLKSLEISFEAWQIENILPAIPIDKITDNLKISVRYGSKSSQHSHYLRLLNCKNFELRYLNINVLDMCVSPAVDHLEKFVYCSPESDVDFSPLSIIKSLRTLEISARNVNFVGFKYVARLKLRAKFVYELDFIGLQDLEYDEVEKKDKNLIDLIFRNSTTIERLSLIDQYYNGVTFPSLPRLKRLDLYKSNSTINYIPIIKQYLSQLKVFYYTNYNPSDEFSDLLTEVSTNIDGDQQSLEIFEYIGNNTKSAILDEKLRKIFKGLRYKIENLLIFPGCIGNFIKGRIN